MDLQYAPPPPTLYKQRQNIYLQNHVEIIKFLVSYPVFQLVPF
jgi:hypothetical protein